MPFQPLSYFYYVDNLIKWFIKYADPKSLWTRCLYTFPYNMKVSNIYWTCKIDTQRALPYGRSLPLVLWFFCLLLRHLTLLSIMIAYLTQNRNKIVCFNDFIVILWNLLLLFSNVFSEHNLSQYSKIRLITLSKQIQICSTRKVSIWSRLQVDRSQSVPPRSVAFRW